MVPQMGPPLLPASRWVLFPQSSYGSGSGAAASDYYIIIIIIIKAICSAQDPFKKAANALSGIEKM